LRESFIDDKKNAERSEKQVRLAPDREVQVERRGEVFRGNR